MERWDVVFLIGFIAYVVIRGVFEERTKSGVERAVRWVDWRERSLMCVVFVGCILLPLVHLFTGWLAFANYQLPTMVPWVGIAAMVAALWLFWRSHADLGQNWSRTLELRKDQTLVRSGVYRSVRHPMYAAILLFCLAQGLLLNNWLAGWSGLLTFTVLYVVRAPREERMLSEFFGDEYRDYMRKSGRLFPRLRARSDT